MAKLSEFKVGDKVRQSNWATGAFREILYLGENLTFTRDQDGSEGSIEYKIAGWEPYQEPKKTVTLYQWLEWSSQDGFLTSIHMQNKPHSHCGLKIIRRLDETKITVEVC